MHPDPQRVVQLFRTDGSKETVGSGYLVRSGLVLCAAHTLDGAGSCCVVVGLSAPRELTVDLADVGADVAPDGKVRPLLGERLLDAEADIGVLGIGDAGAAFDLCRMGRLGRRSATVDAQSLGFPRFKLRDLTKPSPYRDSHVAHGTIDPLANARGNALEFRTTSGPSPAGYATESVWAGMSGAALWVDDRLVGVVAEHWWSEGTSILDVKPLSAVTNEALAAVLGLPEPRDRLPDLTPKDPREQFLGRNRAECLEKCPTDENGRLRLENRKAELTSLANFCSGPERFLWIQGAPWAGKTALAAAFTLNPPKHMLALAIFVSSTTPAEAFLDSCIRGLGAMIRQPVAGLVGVAEKHEKFKELLGEVACEPTFVLVVDGLDEDPHPRGSPSIGELLRFSPPDGIKIIVTSRPAPAAITADHPLSRSPGRVLLTASPEAATAAARAQTELDSLLNAPPLWLSDLLGFLATSEGMTAQELDKLCDSSLTDGIETRLRLDGRAGRVFEVVAGADGHRGRYKYAHAELRRAARESFGSRLDEFARRIYTWADTYAERGWPEDTPAFCLGRYVDLLRERGDLGRLVAVVSDRARRERLLVLTGSHATAAGQIVGAQQALAASSTPDIAGATRLAIIGFALTGNLESIAQPETISFLVRTGHEARAIKALKTIRDRDLRAKGMACVYAGLYAIGSVRKADEFLEAASDEDRRRASRLAAGYLAAERPDVAVRLIGDDSDVGERLIADLALHDDYVEFASKLARGSDQATFALACALAPRRPDDALKLCDEIDRFHDRRWPFWYERDRSYAFVEVARLLKSDELALKVLRELDGRDWPAALVARAARGAADAVIQSDGYAAGGAATRLLAQVAAMAARGEDEPLPEERLRAIDWRDRTDIDIIARFGAQLAGAPHAYRGILRTIVERSTPHYWPGLPKFDQQMHAAVVAGELARIGPLTDADIEKLCAVFGAGDIKGEIFAAAARRMAPTHSGRAVALARATGTQQTWILQDIVATVAANDFAGALKIIDGVEREHTTTRSILVGAAGSHVGPEHNQRAIEELLRRLPQPEEGAAVTQALADCGLRLAGRLEVDDPRGRQYVKRFFESAPQSAQRQHNEDRAVSLARADPENAARAIGSLDAEAAARAALRIVPLLPPGAAAELLEHRARELHGGQLLEQLLTAIVRLDAGRAFAAALALAIKPERLVRILTTSLRCGSQHASLAALQRALAEAPDIDEYRRFIGAWALDRASDGAIGPPPSDPCFTQLRDAIAARDVSAIKVLLRGDLETLDDCLAMSISETPTVAKDAIAAVSEAREHDSFTAEAAEKRVMRLIAVLADTNAKTAITLIDEHDWSAFRNTPGMAQDAREEALANAVTQLPPSDWDLAFDTATRITGDYRKGQALAALAARIPSDWPTKNRAAALRLVLDHAADQRVDGTHFVEDLLLALRRSGAIDRAMQTQLLADTSRWPISPQWLGEMVALVANDLDAVGEAFEGFLVALTDLGHGGDADADANGLRRAAARWRAPDH